MSRHTWRGTLRGFTVQVSYCGGGWHSCVIHPKGHVEAWGVRRRDCGWLLRYPGGKLQGDAHGRAAAAGEAGADLAVIQENVNTRSSMGRFTFTLLSALAQLERDQIAKRTSAAMLRNHAKGRWITRADRCPYGWPVESADPDRLAEDAEEQAVIARIRQERAKGHSLRDIANLLDRADLRCRGGRWDHSTARAILRRADQRRVGATCSLDCGQREQRLAPSPKGGGG